MTYRLHPSISFKFFYRTAKRFPLILLRRLDLRDDNWRILLSALLFILTLLFVKVIGHHLNLLLLLTGLHLRRSWICWSFVNFSISWAFLTICPLSELILPEPSVIGRTLNWAAILDWRKENFWSLRGTDSFVACAIDLIDPLDPCLNRRLRLTFLTTALLLLLLQDRLLVLLIFRFDFYLVRNDGSCVLKIWVISRVFGLLNLVVVALVLNCFALLAPHHDRVDLLAQDADLGFRLVKTSRSSIAALTLCFSIHYLLDELRVESSRMVQDWDQESRLLRNFPWLVTIFFCSLLKYPSFRILVNHLLLCCHLNQLVGMSCRQGCYLTLNNIGKICLKGFQLLWG